MFGDLKTEKYRGADGRIRSRIVTPEMEKQRTLASLPDYNKPFFKGSSYGVEDEKRFLQSLGVQTGQPGTPYLTAQVNAIQADIAKQLQIVQQEKSAVSKMTEDYTKFSVVFCHL